MDQARASVRLHSFSPRGHARSPVDLAIDQAVIRTLRADAPEFERLPVPVRYRASGAVQAWSDARRAAAGAGKRFDAALSDPQYPPLQLVNDVADFVEAHSTLNFKTADGPAAAAHGSHSVYAQAFWQRGGALYEPTSALHRLLDVTDIADNVPVRLLATALPAMCIVPEPSCRDPQGGVEAIALFTHAGADPSDQRRFITFIAWSHWTHPEPRFGSEMLTLAFDDEDEPIGEALERAVQRPPVLHDGFLSMGESRQRWHATLNYVVKMLLYLSLDGAQLLQERPFATAPRLLGGLGKRKREARLAEIDRLYDRYIVGATLLAEAMPSHEATNSGHSPAAHWRRGQFRLQPHGPQSSLRKLVFIMPTVVRVDRLFAA